jgi:hypothetical protein
MSNAEKSLTGKTWWYILRSLTRDEHCNERQPNSIRVECSSIEQDVLVLRIAAQGENKDSIFRVMRHTGIVQGKNYHSRWRIPIPVHVGQKVETGDASGDGEPKDVEFVDIGEISFEGLRIQATRLEANWEEKDHEGDDWVAEHFASNWYSIECGILLLAQRDSTVTPTNTTTTVE